MIFAKFASDQNAFVFKDQLLREMLRTERLRALILMGVIPAAAGIIIFISRFEQSDFTSVLRTSGTEGNILLMSLSFWIYETIVWSVLGHLIRTDRKPPLGIRYFNAMIEISVPTAMMLLLTMTSG